MTMNPTAGSIFRVFVAAAALTITTTLGVAAPARAAFPGQNGRIAYVDTLPGGDEGRNEIFTSHPDGTGRRQLTARGNNDMPRWAPFGHRIAYRHLVLARHSYSHIWVMGGRYGAHKRQLTFGRHNYDTAPAWAPGGQRIAFVRSSDPAHQGLFVYSFESQRVTRLDFGPTFDRVPDQPAWFPDGHTIAFSAARSKDAGSEGFDLPKTELFTVHPNGTGLTQVTDTPHWFEETPDWSPDSSRLIYLRTGGTNFCEQVDTINPDGAGRQLVHAGCFARGPVWSPNGRRILTNAVFGIKGGIWTMSPTGASRRFVASAGPGDWQPHVR